MCVSIYLMCAWECAWCVRECVRECASGSVCIYVRASGSVRIQVCVCVPACAPRLHAAAARGCFSLPWEGLVCELQDPAAALLSPPGKQFSYITITHHTHRMQEISSYTLNIDTQNKQQTNEHTSPNRGPAPPADAPAAALRPERVPATARATTPPVGAARPRALPLAHVRSGRFPLLSSAG